MLRTCQGGGKQHANFMGVMHCPLCVGLAVLSAVRCSILAALAEQEAMRPEWLLALGGVGEVACLTNRHKQTQRRHVELKVRHRCS